MAVRTIKLRIVLDNAQAIRAAQRMGSTLTASAAAGAKGFNAMGVALGGVKSLMVGLLGYQGMMLLLRQLKEMIANIYRADEAMASAWRNHQQRSEKAGKLLTGPAISEQRNIWGNASPQAIAQFYAKLATETGLPGGLRQAASAGFSPFTQLPISQHSPEYRAEVGRDIFKTFGAKGADPVAAGVAWQQMYEIGGLRQRPQWRQGLAQWLTGSELSQYNPSQQTTALERTLPQLRAMGLGYGEVQAATAAFSPFFPKRPKMASRTFEMMAHHIGFRGGRGSGFLHKILRARGIDPDKTRNQSDWAVRWIGAVTDWLIEGDPSNPDDSFEAKDRRMRLLSDSAGMPVRIERTALKTTTGGFMRRYNKYRPEVLSSTYQGKIEQPFQAYIKSMTGQQQVAQNAQESGGVVQSLGTGTFDEATHIMSQQAKHMQSGQLPLKATQAYVKWRGQHGFALGTPADEETWTQIQYLKGHAVTVLASLERVIATADKNVMGGSGGATFNPAAQALKMEAYEHRTRVKGALDSSEAVHIWLSATSEQRRDALSLAVQKAIVFLRRIELGLSPIGEDKADVRTLPWANSLRGETGAAALRDWKDPFTWGTIPGALPGGGYGSQPTDVLPAGSPNTGTTRGQPGATTGASVGGVIGASASPTIIQNNAVAYMATPSDSALTTFGRIT